MKKYKLTVTEDQARFIMRGLEAINRAGLKQYDYALEEICPGLFMAVGGLNEMWNIRDYIRLKEGCNLPTHASFGISNSEVPDEARDCYDMVQVIRNRIAWDNAEHDESERCEHFCKYMQVSYDKPIQYGKIGLIKMEQIKNEKS